MKASTILNLLDISRVEFTTHLLHIPHFEFIRLPLF